MSDWIFGKSYAEQYDFFYRDKDYEAECDMVEEIFKGYHTGRVHTILDLGCGTGIHATILASRGYQVIGVDRSEDMLAKARQTASVLQDASCKHVAFYNGDLRATDLGQQFDAVLMMFAVLGYQLTNDDVLAALHTARHHLRPDGLFICDVWYGPAVLTIRPSDRLKIIPTEDGKIIRVASGSLDTLHHLSTVHYRIWQLKGRQVLSESEEIHKMRYFFPQELALFMAHEQMKLIHMSNFENPAESPDERTWNILAVGSAF